MLHLKYIATAPGILPSRVTGIYPRFTYGLQTYQLYDFIPILLPGRRRVTDGRVAKTLYDLIALNGTSFSSLDRRICENAANH